MATLDISVADAKAMKVVQLRAKLQEYGLSAKGLKPVLQARLIEHIELTEAGANDVPPPPEEQVPPPPAADAPPAPDAGAPPPADAPPPAAEPPTGPPPPEPEASGNGQAPEPQPAPADAPTSAPAPASAETPATAPAPADAGAAAVPAAAMDTSNAPQPQPAEGPDAKKDEREDRSRSSRDDRDRDRDRRRDRSRDRSDRHRDRDRDRDRDRHRDRRRDDDRRRSRDYDRDRDRDRDYRRRDRSRSRERGVKRSREDDQEGGSSRESGERKSRRKWASKAWDVAPEGYEDSTPAQYKEMMAAGKVPAGGPGPAAMPQQVGVVGPNLQLTRQARRLYIGNIPFGISEPAMTAFFNDQMRLRGLTTGPGDPVLVTQINVEKNFAFLEIRSVEETSRCLVMDNAELQGQNLRVKRPKDYTPLPGQGPPPMMGGPMGMPPMMDANLNKIYIGNLPLNFDEDNVKELLSVFGTLKNFSLVKDPDTNESKGYAFCEFESAEITDLVITGLSDTELGDKKLEVMRGAQAPPHIVAEMVKHLPPTLPPGFPPMPGMPGFPPMPGMPAGMPGFPPMPGMPPGMAPPPGGLRPTRVLVLLNMVTKEELTDDEEYGEIVLDVKEEASKFGTVVNIEIPRPTPGAAAEEPGVGKIYVEFTSVPESCRAQLALGGRKFANRTVVTSWLEEEKFKNKEWQ